MKPELSGFVCAGRKSVMAARTFVTDIPQFMPSRISLRSDLSKRDQFSFIEATWTDGVILIIQKFPAVSASNRHPITMGNREVFMNTSLAFRNSAASHQPEIQAKEDQQ